MSLDAERITSLEAAAARIRDLAEDLADGAGGRTVVIGIAGAVGSGKSTLARLVSDCVVGTDRYLPNYAELPQERWDHPDEADLDRLSRDLTSLREGRAASVPEWSFFEHRRVGEARVEPAPLVVCEGLFALEDLVVEHIDIPVLVTAEAETRWRRATERESSQERGWSLEQLREHFERHAEPLFAASEPHYRRRARIIVQND